MRNRISAMLAIAACIGATVFSHRAAIAQGDSPAWPQRTVRFIIPFGPGAASDTAARLLAPRLQDVWGKPVIVENKPGGDGLISIGAFVSAKDDHTLLLTPSTVFVVHPYTQENLPYDYERDFRPISWISTTPIGVAVPAALPVKTMKDFVEHAKRQGGKVNYGVGVGFLEFVWDGFRREHNVPMVKVPFRDVVQAPLDLGEGRIDVLMTSLTTHRPMLQAGKTKLIAICDPQRNDQWPDVQTVVEAGYPGLLSPSMNVLFGPSQMPLQLRERLAKDIAEALKDKGIADKLRISGQQLAGSGPEGVTKAVSGQLAQVDRIAKVLGVARKR